MRHRRHGFIKTLLSLIFVAILVEAGFVGWSAWQIKGKSEAVTSAFESYDAQVNNEDYSGALASLRLAADNIQGINQELKGWQWQVAAKIPYLGEDVSCGQKAAQISDNLVSQAMLPVLKEAESLFGNASSSDFMAMLSEKASQASGLVNALENARAVVSTCRSEAYALPTSHFSELNQLVVKLQQVIVEADETFDDFSGILDVASSVNDFASSLV